MSDVKSIILEIRAGVGGNEAAIFASDLANMYSRFAAKQGWSAVILDESKNELGGYKEVFLEISGEGVYDKIKQESGVHRVQRVPATEKSGRVHTSTASVAVLPIRTELKTAIKPQDLKSPSPVRAGPAGRMSTRWKRRSESPTSRPDWSSNAPVKGLSRETEKRRWLFWRLNWKAAKPVKRKIS